VGSLLDKVTEFLTREGLEYRRMRDVDAVEMGVAGDNGNYRVVIVSDQDRPVMRFLTFVEGRVPATRRREAMEFITRANYGLLVGNFEFDLDDGEVRFKAAGDYEDGDMSPSSPSSATCFSSRSRWWIATSRGFRASSRAHPTPPPLSPRSSSSCALSHARVVAARCASPRPMDSRTR